MPKIKRLMIGRFSKTLVMPDKLPMVSKIGYAAVKPVEAINPGRIRSSDVRLVPVALRPSPAKLSNTTSVSIGKLLRINAKAPT